MPGERTTRRNVSHPEWSVVRNHLHLRIKDAAVVLNATAKYLRRLCRDNGLSSWPGKKIRSWKAMGLELDASDGSGPAGLDGQANEVVGSNIILEDDEVRVNSLVIANQHPPQELTTLNLIDKVGLPPSTSE
nr:unnamed protein product [Digitaria exilis]